MPTHRTIMPSIAIAAAMLVGLGAHATTTQPGHADDLPLILHEVAAIPVPGAEVVSYDPERQRFWIATDFGIRFVEREADTWRVREAQTPPAGIVTHVQVDPAARGFVLAGFFPTDPRARGHILALNADDGSLIARWPAGHGPDCIVITPCGNYALSADEGEPVRLPDGTIFDPPASITRIDLTGITNRDELATLSADRIVTAIPDRNWVLDQLKQEPAVRIHPDNAETPELDLEPEYIAVLGDTAWITLQENNALARFDIPSATWQRLIAIPRITNTIDASDRDGINITTRIHCLPMPDQLVVLGTPDDPIIFFPGEGDTRAELGENAPFPDHARHRALVRAGLAKPHPTLDRLKVCAFTGDTTNDGIIDTPHAFGSRALHRYRPATNEWLDTADLIEQTIARHTPKLFNANSTNLQATDSRSDDKGPEPEGIAVGKLDGQPIIFIGLERPGGVMAFDTDLNLLAFDMGAARGHTAPEGMVFVPADTSPLATPLLVVGYETSGTLVIYEIRRRNYQE